MAKRIAFVLAAVLAVYLIFAASRGFSLLQSSSTAVKLLGVCVMILPILGGLLIVREIRFGYASSELAKKIDVALLPTGDVKPRSEEAQTYLNAVIERTKQDQENWQNWFCVGVGYDLVGQRKLARESLQHAIELAKQIVTSI